MTCPELGRWRAWLDGEVDRPAVLSDHLTTCRSCAEAVEELRHDASLAGTALATLARGAAPTPLAMANARARLGGARSGVNATQPDLTRLQPRRAALAAAQPLRRWRVALAGLAASLALGFFVLTPDGQSAAAEFLAQFRSQRFTAVTVDAARGSNPFRDLERIGTVKGDRSVGRGESVASLSEASRRVGFGVKQPDSATLPGRLVKAPAIRVSPPNELRFTFDKAKARAYFDQTGHAGLSLPDKFDGVSLVVRMPAAAMLEYRATDGSPGVMVGQSRELEVGVDGNATLDELRDFLLSLPNLPPETARQLRSIKDWRNTLPVPVPADQVRWQETTIAGGPGLLLAENSGLGSAAIWQRDGRVYGIAGSLKPDELKRVADSLR